MADTQAPPPRDRNVSVVSNVLAIAGLIILIIIVLWGLLHILSLSGGWFSSLFSGSGNSSIRVTAPAQSYSGDPLTVSWSYSPDVKGTYAFVYQCKAGLSFAAPSGASLSQIPCGIAYTLGTATSSATVLPLLSGTSSVSESLTIIYIPSATSTQTGVAAQGSAVTVVHAAKTATVPPAQTPAKPAPAPAPSGQADLAITAISGASDPYGNATVSFDITNVGGAPSGAYYFSAQLPTSQPYTYSSPPQTSLAPGSHVVSTLNFTSAVQGVFTVHIGSGNDGNAANNYASLAVNVPYNQYQSPYQPYYQNAPQPYYGNQQYYYSNGLPYYVNSGQYPYIVPGSY